VLFKALGSPHSQNGHPTFDFIFTKMRSVRVSKTFNELFTGQLAAELIDELRSIGIVSATEVQEKAIAAILTGKSAIVTSPTGSGVLFGSRERERASNKSEKKKQQERLFRMCCRWWS
jgi:hypothetical protein